MIVVRGYCEREDIGPDNEAVGRVGWGGEDGGRVMSGESVAVEQEDVLERREEDGEELKLKAGGFADMRSGVVD